MVMGRDSPVELHTEATTVGELKLKWIQPRAFCKESALEVQLKLKRAWTWQSLGSLHRGTLVRIVKA